MPTKVRVTLEQAQTVAVGAFNPYVITPGWLVKYRLCARDEEVNVRMVPLGEGAAFVFGPVQWQVNGQRLSVSSADRNVDCGNLVSQVLSFLPHTPVQAMGHNFQFTGTKAEWGDRPEPRLGTKGLEDLEGAEQVRWSSVFRRDDARLEVTLAHEQGLVAVLFNFHRNMNLEIANAAPTPEEQIAQARDAAAYFRADFDHSKEMLRSFFEMEMSDE
jgi:hypothetical protein